MAILGGGGKVRQTIEIDSDVSGAVRGIDKVDRSLGSAGRAMDKTGGQGKRMGHTLSTGIGVGLVAVAAGAVQFGKSAVAAFRDADASMAAATSMLDRNNKGWRAHKGEIDKTIKAHMDLSKFDDEDLYKSFANLSRISGDTAKGMKLQAVAMDLARARGISLETATNIVGKASIGSTKALKGMGIELDKNATGTQAVAALQKNFGGAAKRYGDSSAGAAEAMNLAWGNFQEDIGRLIVPALSVLLGILVGTISVIQNHATAVTVAVAALGAFLVVLYTVKAALMLNALWVAATTLATSEMTAAQWLLNAALTANPIGIVVVALAALVAGLIIAYKSSGTFRAIVQGAFDAVLNVAQVVAGFFTSTLPAAFQAVLDWVKGNWPLIATLVAGPFAPVVALATNAFGIRSALTGAFEDVLTFMGQLPGRVLAKATAISTTIASGLRAAAWGMGNLLQERIVQPMLDVGSRVTGGATSLSGKVASGLKAAVWDMASLLHDRVVQPIVNIFDDVFAKGQTLAGKLASGIRDGAVGAWDALVGKFKALLNQIIAVVNHIPFVDIKPLAHGAVVHGPTLAVVGEDGPEVVVPVGSKRRKRGQELLTKAALMLGGSGDGPGDNRNLSHAGIPMLANGGMFGGAAGDWAATQVLMLKAKATHGWGEQLAGFARNKLADLAGLVPTPSMGNPVLDGVLHAAHDSAVSAIRGVEAKKDEWSLGKIFDGKAWADSVMGKPYVWGGGHGGWNPNLPGYDCSGFASHAAHYGGSTIGSPLTTGGALAAGSAGKGPAYWGLRGMNNASPRQQHMGMNFLGTWYQFGDPGHTGGDDSQWQDFRVPPGLPAYGAGGTVGLTGPAMLHGGEEVLNRRDAAAYRAGRAGTQVQLVVHPAMGWLEDFIEVKMDGQAESARRRALAGGRVR